MESSISPEIILAASDLSEGSDEVLRSAGALARASGAVLHVLHSFDLSPSPYVQRGAGARPSFFGRLEQAAAALRAQVERTVPPGVSVAEQRVEIYTAHRAITEWARASGAGLIVLGPHARGGPAGMLGSTAEAVLRTATVPCLVVRRPLRLPLRHVVVPLDLSRPALAALETGADWAARFGGEADAADGGVRCLSVVHVVPGEAEGEDDDFSFDEEVVEGSLRRQVRQAVRRAGADGGLRVETRVVHDERPAAAIVAFAERTGADLVALSPRGYGAVKRLLLGSTAAAVVRRAPCSVLLVPRRPRRTDA